MKSSSSLRPAKKRGKTFLVCRRGRWFVLPVNKVDRRLKTRQA